ncbi:MAG: hypothetical protein QW687_03095 [Candidatus Hadarchaeales archaeon]
MPVGVLGVSYGSRFACLADTLCRSWHMVRLFIADRQRNPFNLKKAQETGGEHVVIPDLNVRDIVKFAKKHAKEISFGILGPEGPGIQGIRDVLEKETGIKMICPSLEYFIEKSKVKQRKLLEEVAPEANPRFKVFDPAEIPKEKVKEEVYRWLDEVGERVAVKPDAPATGKGVGVWGDHFRTREEMFYEYFLPSFSKGPVIVEEKLEGEEFSLQFLSDGEHLIPTPCVRDYKRAFDWDQGPNTGGMGSYKDVDELLPFMERGDWEQAIEIAERLHRRLKGEGRNPKLMGVMYMGYILTREGVKVLEVNSRWGDPEVMNLMPLLEDDFVEICFRCLDGELRGMRFKRKASVVIYAVPLEYGGHRKYSGPRRVRLEEAEALKAKYGEDLRLYPGSLEVRENGELWALSSRTVAAVGIGDDLERAREIALEAIRRVDGPLRHREDIALREHVKRSIEHMRALRS